MTDRFVWDESTLLVEDDESEKLLKRRDEAPELSQERQKLQAAIYHFFTKTASEIAASVRHHEKLAKADPGALFVSLPPIQWDDLVPDLFGSLNTVARTSAGRAIANLNIDGSRMISDINDVAADWADRRAAELVGMKRLPSGKLVANPDARWQITTRTRDGLRQIVTDAFEHKTSMTDLADDIQKAGIFSSDRAGLIAKTEVIRAENNGNLAGWRKSGVVLAVDWLLSADHNPASPCNCSYNSENGPYKLDKVPESPDHPGCECSLVVARLAGQSEPDAEED